MAGDGTTTATLLTRTIFAGGLKAITAGVAPSRLNQGLGDGAEAVANKLENMAKAISGNDEVKQIATISANNDSEVGKLISDAMKKVGRDGVITVEDGKSMDTTVDIVEGMQFDRGFLSPHFVTNAEEMECQFENALVLVHEGKISTVNALLPVLEAVKESGRHLLLIAEDVENEALATLVVNKMRGVVSVCAVKAPGYGDRRKQMLLDIAALTGATAIMKDTGTELEHVTPQHLGAARRVTVSTDATTIIGGKGKRADVEDRVGQIRREIETTTSDYDREKLQERLAKLTGGIAQINVGGATDTEVKERKALIEDALHATRAAVAEGILPGGGTALLRAREVIKGLKVQDDVDYNIGLDVLYDALAGPVDPDRQERRPGRRGGRPPGRARAQGQLGLRRSQGRVLRHAREGHRRPRQGDQVRAPERGQRRLAPPDDGRAHRDQAGEEGPAPRDGGHGRHGWHGRHG